MKNQIVHKPEVQIVCAERLIYHRFVVSSQNQFLKKQHNGHKCTLVTLLNEILNSFNYQTALLNGENTDSMLVVLECFSLKTRFQSLIYILQNSLIGRR